MVVIQWFLQQNTAKYKFSQGCFPHNLLELKVDISILKFTVNLLKVCVK